MGYEDNGRYRMDQTSGRSEMRPIGRRKLFRNPRSPGSTNVLIYIGNGPIDDYFFPPVYFGKLVTDQVHGSDVVLIRELRPEYIEDADIVVNCNGHDGIDGSRAIISSLRLEDSVNSGSIPSLVAHSVFEMRKGEGVAA
ncbi:MAG: hypothetical protein ABIH37_04690 [archaeon]